MASLRFLVALAGFASAAVAQIPPDHLVVASFRGASFGYPGADGITLVNLSSSPASAQAMTSLPALCSGAGLNAAGNQCTVHLATNGKLVATGGDLDTAPVPIEIYVITPGASPGTSAANVVTYPLGTYTNVNGVGVSAMAELGDGRVLLALDPTSVGGPFAGQALVILDPSLPPGPGAFTAVPVPAMPYGDVNAMAVDIEAQLAYFSIGNNIWRVPVPGGGYPALIANTPQIHALAVESDGQILAGGPLANFTAAWLRRIDPVTRVVTNFANVTSLAGAVNALYVEPVTGDLFFGFVPLPGPCSVQRLSPRTSTGSIAPVNSMTSCISGIDAHSRLEVYGAASGTAPIARWQLAPNPGGAPVPGNLGFSLTCSAEPGASYLWALGFARANVPVTTSPPVTLYVQPETVMLLPTNTMALPIPAIPALAGVQIFAQCAQLLPGGGVRATSGLQCNL